MYGDEKNAISYTEISGTPYIRRDNGYIEPLEPIKRELYAKPPTIETDFDKISKAIYFNYYRRVNYTCDVCERVIATMVEDKNKIFYICDCGKITFVNDL